MAAHLSNGRINLAILRESYRRELLECLDKCTGSKAIVWDEALTGPFGLIAEYSLLKEHEVDKMFPLQEGRLPPSNVHNIIFFVRPQLELMNLVAQNLLREDDTRTLGKEFHIFFIPRKSLLCEKKLKDLGVYGNFTNIDEYCIDMIPFDSDLLSMEMENTFKDCFLENDMTGLYHIAKSLMTLQTLYGFIPSIYGKGHCAQFVSDMMLRMRRELSGTEPHIASQIDNILLLDRTVDPLTPLLSQLTYEGLIDDLFGINNTTVKLPPEKFAASTSTPDGTQEVSTEPKKIVLNSSEELFSVLRDKNFNAVGPTLSQRAKTITAQFETRHDAKTIGEIKQFVSQLPHMQQSKQSLATHTSIAELIKEVTNSDEFMNTLRTQQEFFNGLETDKPHSYIEDCIAKQEPLWKVLKLVCIQSFCNGGFRQKLVEYYKREIIQTYGFEHILTLGNLEKIGLLKIQTNRMYSILNKSLRLVMEEVNEQNPDDVAYVFSGYAPLSVRLAQFLHQPGWRSIMEVLNLLPGPTVEEIQQIPIGLRKRRGSVGSTHSSTTDQKVTLVVFIGGVTYAEVSALRFLSQSEDAPVEYLVATSKIINSSSWLKSMQTHLKPKPVNPF